MYKPSRYMPKFMRKPIRFAGWLVLAGLIGLVLYVLWQKPLFVMGFAIVIFCASWLQHRLVTRQLHRLAAERGGEDIGSFTRALDYRDLDTWVIRAVYEQLQAYLASEYPNFPLRGSDDLSGDLKIDQGDLEEIIAAEIAQRCGRDLQSTKSNPYYGKVKTVGDLVRFCNAQPVVVNKSVAK